MATTIHLTRTLDGRLVPADAESQEAIYELPLGRVIKAVVSLPRNYRRLQWWWKLCEIVSENSEHYPSKESVSDMLKLKTGHFTTIVVPGKQPGEWVTQYVPKSIAFGKLDEPSFKALCNRAVEVCARYVLGCESAELDEAVSAFFEGRRAA